MSKHGTVPLEVLIDLRCENQTFERLVPQTEASFQYDKFNRLRLRNKVTSVKTRAHTQDSSSMSDSHLQDQTVGAVHPLRGFTANLLLGSRPCQHPALYCVCQCRALPCDFQHRHQATSILRSESQDASGQARNNGVHIRLYGPCVSCCCCC